MPPPAPTADELLDLLVTLLTGAAGKTEAHWRKVVGPVEVLLIVFHPRSNWAVHPKGSAADLAVVAKAVEIVRGEHPYVG